MLSQKILKLNYKLNKQLFVDEVSAKFFDKKNFAGKEKSFVETSLTLRGDFVDKFFTMCRWAYICCLCTSKILSPGGIISPGLSELHAGMEIKIKRL